MEISTVNTESHPLEPFLPQNAVILLLGSFPPKHERWSMEFFYPNFNNDMWRIMGLLFYGDRSHFVRADAKKFDREKIAGFCREKGIALFDTATEIRRLKDNASDAFLEIVTPTDIGALLARIPECRAIVATGQKAAETLAAGFGCTVPAVGGSVETEFAGRRIALYRMPSSSRAYPLPLERKADAYRAMFTAEKLLSNRPNMKIAIDDRISLRPLESGDADEIFAILDSHRERMRRWLPFVDFTLSPDDSARFVDSVLHGEEKIFAIIHDDRFIGIVGFRSTERENDRTEIGYWLSPEYHGRGIMTRCVRRVCEYAFSQMSMHRIAIKCAVGNHASRAIPLKLGFTFEGTEIDGEKMCDGSYADIEVYSLVRKN